MTLALLTLALASDWPTPRGPDAGTQAVPGSGAITGLDEGYPAYSWTTTYSSTSYTIGYSTVLDVDGDGTPEVIGVSRSRVTLWDGDGTVLAASDSFATPVIHGLYDLDGDGLDHELVVVGTGVGGGVFVLDATTLALLWRNEDPGDNGGGSVGETLISDSDGDGVPELLWTTSFQGYSDYQLVSFITGFTAPDAVTYTLPNTATGQLPAVAGDYLGVPGAYAVEQGTVVTLFQTTDRLDPEAEACSAAGTRCMKLHTQYGAVHASYTSGDRIAFDASGDGDAEYLTVSASDLTTVDVAVLDPSAGVDTASALLWAYRYGVGTGAPLNQFAYASAGQGFASSVGGAAVAVTVYNDTATETDASGVPADDCLDAADAYGVVVFDAETGLPLANLVSRRAWGTMDGDRDGVPEIVVTDATAAVDVAGYELVCDGPGTAGAWGSCADTGCRLEQAWTLAGTLPRLLQQQIPPDSYRPVEASAPALVDLDGDGSEEVLVRSGGDLVGYRIGTDGSATEVGRHVVGTCGTVGGWTGTGADTWLLLEGAGCYAVLDAALDPAASFTVDATQGVGLSLVGDLGGSVPVISLGTKIYDNPGSPASMAAPVQSLTETPVHFVDVDGDGVDELLTMFQPAVGNWRVVEYGWDGTTFVERWRTTAADLGVTDRSLNVTYGAYQFTTGDFDGDGDRDLAFFVSNPERGASAEPLNGDIFALDGRTGSLVAHLVAPGTGISSTYASPMYAADLCAGTTCPGTDGADEIVFVGANSASWYGIGGALLSYSIDPTSEAMYADFDGDGEVEIGLGAGFTGTGLYHVQVVELDGTLLWEATPPSASGSYVVHAAADIDEDGAADLVVGGGYGEITVYSGRDGSVVDGFPVYLDGGSTYPASQDHARRVLQLALADIDGDGHVEAIIGHDDGTVYALNLSPAEGAPSVAWATFPGVPVYAVRPIDADGDGQLEVLVLANDGTARLIDAGDVTVVIDSPVDDACSSDDTLTLSGTARGTAEVEVFIQGVSAGVAPVDGGAWTITVPWPGEGEFRVEAYAVVNDELVASDVVLVDHYSDDDGDGVSECDDDCDDGDASRYPGALEVCDGLDTDCSGTAADEADDDADGYRACDECDDGDPDVSPVGVEVCNEVDDDCDGAVDEGDLCIVPSVYQGGGGCTCGTTGASAPWSLAALIGVALLVRRRR